MSEIVDQRQEFYDQNPYLVFSMQLLANSTGNGTSNDSKSASNVLSLSYIAIAIIVGALVGGLFLVYCLCFHQTINKKKIHMLVRETNLDDL
jgi:hypothetical protein